MPFMTRSPLLSVLFSVAVVGSALGAQSKNCSRTSTGLVPLIDMGTTRYQNQPGGLYPGGNTLPAAHAAAGAAQARAVQPLDTTGAPNPAGKIVLVSIGMSNTTQEFSEFVRISDADPQRNPSVVVADLAQGGMDATKVAQPDHVFWTNALNRLTAMNLTAQQVQVAWLKEAVAGPTKPFPTSAQELRDLLAQIARNLKAKFPNIRICYVSSRIYAGYAGTTLNPEPFAYESGFSVKWLIENQIGGDPMLNFDPSRGSVVAPWLAWGPYLWADGTRPRSDGLIWECADLADDGTHPSAAGRAKVAVQLNDYFTTAPTATVWYGGTAGGLAAVRPYGTACAGSVGSLGVRWNSLPRLGNANFAFGMTGAKTGTLALLLLSANRVEQPIQGCTLLVDPAAVWFVQQASTNASGTASARFAIPSDETLVGARAFGQWINQDSGSSNLQILGGGAATQGVELVVGH